MSDKSRKSLLGTVLVVDDDSLLLSVIAEIVAAAGYVVQTAISADKALDILDQMPIDLVLTDVMMPKLSGFDLLKAIRKKFGIKPVVVLMSGYSNVSPWDTYHFGAEGYIGKPFEFSQLTATLLFIQGQKIKMHGDGSVASGNRTITAVSSSNGQHITKDNFGRNGIFVRTLDNSLGKGELVNFALPIDDPIGIFTGTGMIIWVRGVNSAQKLPSGIGIEFASLDQKSYDYFAEKIKKDVLIPWIPRA